MLVIHQECQPVEMPIRSFQTLPWPSGSVIGPLQALLTLDSCHQQVKDSFPGAMLPCPATREEGMVHLF